jgi:hypothetical protein
MKRYAVPFLCLWVTGLLGGCSAYERTNPLDPSYPLVLTIVGPDTIRSVNDTVQFQLVAEPAHSALPVVWSTSAAIRLNTVDGQPGTFTSIANGTAVIKAEVGPHVAEKEVVVEQRPVRLSISPPGPAQLSSLGEVLNLTASIVDAKNSPLANAPGDLQWLSSDLSVADVSNGRVTARGNGQAWIHATSLGQADSMRVSVQQLPVTMQFNNASYTIAIPGGSVQTVLSVRDARNNLIASPAGLTLTSSRSTFQVGSSGLVQSTGFGSTVVTARLGELTATTNVRVIGGTAPVVSALNAGLTGFPGSPRNFLLIEMDTRDSELDLDEATLEVYSTAVTWMATRVVPLVQGQASLTTVVAIPQMANAGTVRVRVRDAALNNSSQTTWVVSPQPQAGAPDVNILGATTAPGSVTVTAQPIKGVGDLRALYLFGFDAAGEVVLSTNVPQPNVAGEVITLNNPTGLQIAYVGAVVSDTAGRLSLLKRFEIATASTESVAELPALASAAFGAAMERGSTYLARGAQ